MVSVDTLDDPFNLVLYGGRSDAGFHLENEVGSAIEGHYELMQFTGLTDKNGREIYEGDIVRMKQSAWGFIEHLIVMEWNEEHLQVQARVLAVNGEARGTARVGDAYGFSVLDRWREQVEVIGNIYENPDLSPKVDPKVDQKAPV